jgi:hypothetical protein
MKVKQAYMAMTEDDQGEPPAWLMKQAQLSDFSDEELRAELDRRWNEEVEAVFQPILEKFNEVIERMSDGGE